MSSNMFCIIIGIFDNNIKRPTARISRAPERGYPCPDSQTAQKKPPWGSTPALTVKPSRKNHPGGSPG